MKIKLLHCHNKRLKPSISAGVQECVCNKILGGIDEELLSISKRNGFSFSNLYYCGPCASFVLVNIADGEATIGNIDKSQIDFNNSLVPDIRDYKIKSTAIRS